MKYSYSVSDTPWGVTIVTGYRNSRPGQMECGYFDSETVLVFSVNIFHTNGMPFCVRTDESIYFTMV